MQTQFPFVVIAFLASVCPASPCSVAGPVPTALELLSRAELVVRARATVMTGPATRASVKAEGFGRVRFVVVDILKGRLDSKSLELTGRLEAQDDRNDQSVPYSFIRRGGRHGNCYALNYRSGAEYLLLLHRAEVPNYAELNELTPYWSPLSPTNEQLFDGTRDPWLIWVSAQLRHGA